MQISAYGYEYAQETQLYYLQSRYYDPQLCRFLNADGLASTDQGFIGNNMFAYCGNNPVDRLDSAGTAYINVDACWDGGPSYGAALPYVPNDSQTVNCLGYAFGIDEVLKPCDNYAADFSLDKAVSGTYDIARQYGITLRELESYDSPIDPNEYRMVLKVGEKDYHYMIQHSDGSWSHKSGLCPTELFIGDDPGAVAWDLVETNKELYYYYGIVDVIGIDKKGYYDSRPVYFAVSK